MREIIINVIIMNFFSARVESDASWSRPLIHTVEILAVRPYWPPTPLSEWCILNGFGSDLTALHIASDSAKERLRRVHCIRYRKIDRRGTDRGTANSTQPWTSGHWPASPTVLFSNSPEPQTDNRTDCWPHTHGCNETFRRTDRRHNTDTRVHTGTQTVFVSCIRQQSATII